MITMKIDFLQAEGYPGFLATCLRQVGVPLSAEPPYPPLRGVLFRTLDPNTNIVTYRWSDDPGEIAKLRGNTQKLDDYDNQVSNLAEDGPRGGGWIVLGAFGILCAGIALLVLISNLIASALQ